MRNKTKQKTRSFNIMSNVKLLLLNFFFFRLLPRTMIKIILLSSGQKENALSIIRRKKSFPNKHKNIKIVIETVTVSILKKIQKFLFDS